MVCRWTGTLFSLMCARSASAPILSSIHMGLNLRHDDFIASNIDIQRRQRFWRRSGDVLAIQIELTVVAGTDNQLLAGIVLNRAIQMRAARGESLQFTF